jgi:hypothetical protein
LQIAFSAPSDALAQSKDGRGWAAAGVAAIIPSAKAKQEARSMNGTPDTLH